MEPDPHPAAVAEVLSPTTATRDRFLKRIRYREAGVPLYPPGALEPFSLSLAELFRPL
jgi:hypothetical protein